VGDAGDVVAAAPGGDLGGDADGGAGVVEDGGADLDGAGAAAEELQGVFAGADAADADHWEADGLGEVVDHAEGDGLDGGAGETARAAGEAPAAGRPGDPPGAPGVCCRPRRP